MQGAGHVGGGELAAVDRGDVVELDPLAALMLRANLAVRGWAGRATVHVKDYRELTLPRCTGTTAFIGNPPYVRHHDIAEAWKIMTDDIEAALMVRGLASMSPLADWPDGIASRVVETWACIEGERAALRDEARSE